MRWRIVGRLEAGQSQAQVAREMDITPSVISNLWSQLKTSGTVCKRPGQGQQWPMNIGISSFQLSARGRLQPLNCLGTSRLLQEHQFRVRLLKRGLYTRKPAICTPLPPSQKRALAEWCRQHKFWTQLQWANILFTDESRFSLQTDSGQLLIWREPVTRCHPSNIIERDHYAGWRLRVWVGIMQDTRTPLHVFDNDSMNAQRYRQEVLELYGRCWPCVVSIQYLNII